MGEATNYYRWLMGSFEDLVGERSVEAGAGVGTVSEMLLNGARPTQLTLVEPAANNLPLLRKRFLGDPRVRVHHGYMEDLVGTLTADSVIAVNVLEHVEADENFLRAAYDLLSPGGVLLLLVPAVPAIFGSLDRAFEHFRRYTKSGLRRSLLGAGFEVETLRYMNLLGVLAWFVSGRVFHRTTLGRRQVRFYDRWVIPAVRRLEALITPPIGQSLLAVARKPAGVVVHPKRG
jgi:SAM-dependent methyltransferase